jgi:hypothetical protein
MESNFTNDEFEDFLKRSADGIRMRPSDQVWEGIAANLKKRRRRVAFASSAFLLLSSVLGYFLLDNPRQVASTSVATLPSEIQGKSNIPSSPSHSLTSSLSTEAKVIDIKQHPSHAYDQPASAGQSSLQEKHTENKRNQQVPTVMTLATPNEFTPTVVDSDPVATVTTPTSIEPEETSVKNPLSIESVTNLFKAGHKKAKMRVQVYFTPTVSYRKLSENKSYLRSLPQPSLLTSSRTPSFNINDAVTHKPDLGLELGLATRYPLTNNINLRGGLQFNINRYDIKAFRSSPEVATIALNRGNDNGVDFVGSISDYRNFSGFKSDWLQNFYFQVSAPLGAEVHFDNNKKTHFGVAGTVQPTYLIGDRSYVISSDYKNYSEVPWLTRRWNVNASAEAFVSYSSGRMNWQVGPQVRYQLLSSFIEKYPVKENLFDFGFKVGVSINKKDTEKKDSESPK